MRARYGLAPGSLLVGAVLCAVALTASASGPAVAASARQAAAPVIVGVTPTPDPSDRTGPLLVRATFSPDGDGRGDRLRISVRAPAGARMELWVHRASNRIDRVRTVTTVSSEADPTLVWDGRGNDGRLVAPGSYVIEVCNASARHCAGRRVVVRLRVMTLFVPLTRGVSVGERIPVELASDRRGPFRVDVVRPGDPTGRGSGLALVDRPGRLHYRVPHVAPGLEVLRVRSGRFMSFYPLVVHGTAYPLDDPPRGAALVVFPFLTWRAYDASDNDRNGKVDSWYSHPLEPSMPLLGPFSRYRTEQDIASRETTSSAGAFFSRWLNHHHLVAQHVTDIELGDIPPATLRRYAMIAFPDHTEYYQARTYHRLLRYRNAGGHLYFLAGNPFYGEVRITPTQLVRMSYRFRNARVSDFRLASVGFRSCCWPATIAPRYHLLAGVRARLPWLFRGTDVTAGDAFGLALREVDTTNPALSPPGTIRIASAVVPAYSTTSEAVYGYIGTRPIPFEPGPRHDRRIDIAYAETGAGRGSVYSWGNNGFIESLYRVKVPVAERKELDRIALNVWEHFTGTGEAR